jgi:5-methylcytosine-specific restriction enzyme A
MPDRPAITRPPASTPGPSTKRLSSRQRGYTTAWDKASRAFLAAHPLCFYCELLGRIVAAEHTDHYDPAPAGSEAFWDEARWRPACSYHNSGKRDTPGDVYVAQLLNNHRQAQSRPQQS